MPTLPKEHWTWGNIKKLIETEGIKDDDFVWYIDINVERADRSIVLYSGKKKGIEVTNHPEI
jgi:hypothetical protein